MSDISALLGTGMARKAATEIQGRKQKINQALESADGPPESPAQEQKEGIFFKAPQRTPEQKARQQKMLVEALRRRDRDFE